VDFAVTQDVSGNTLLIVYILKQSQLIIRLMLGRVTNGIQSGLRACDLFAVTQFVRYKGESDFKTATGGFCSVSILTIFAVLFTSLAIKTVNRDIISWSS
jgi:hypothetical protein